MNVAVVRPLVDHLYDPDDVSVVYCLLVNRENFVQNVFDVMYALTLCRTLRNPIPPGTIVSSPSSDSKHHTRKSM
jgi:hypothetical protein